MPNGDGEGLRVTIDAIELRPGWVLFQPGSRRPKPSELPWLLSRAMTDWLLTHPEASVRAALPLTVNGHTVGLHLWLQSAPPTASGTGE